LAICGRAMAVGAATCHLGNIELKETSWFATLIIEGTATLGKPCKLCRKHPSYNLTLCALAKALILQKVNIRSWQNSTGVKKVASKRNLVNSTFFIVLLVLNLIWLATCPNEYVYGSNPFPRLYPVGVHLLKHDDEGVESVLPGTSVGSAYAVKFTAPENGLVTLIKIADTQPPPPLGGMLRSFVVRVVAADGFTDMTSPLTIQIGDGYGVYKYLGMANKGVHVSGAFYVVLQRNLSSQDNSVCLDTSSNSGNSFSNIPSPSSSSPITGSGNTAGNIMIQVMIDTQDSSFSWGSPGSNDRPVLMDVDQDTQLDPAIFRNGIWFIAMSTRCYDTNNLPSPVLNFPENTGSPLIFSWGTVGDIPFGGDVDGDGLGPTGGSCGSFDDLIIWRPSTGCWYIQLLSHASGPPQPSTRLPPIPWGKNGDIPIVSPRWSDFDGDGKVDLVIWRPENGHWYILLSSKGYDFRCPPGAYLIYAWGTQGDVPLLADIDFDQKADLVIWRPSNGHWYILLSSRGYSTSSPKIIAWGTRGDVPLVISAFSIYSADLAIWRPSTSMWYLLSGDSGFKQSRIIAFGANGDLPLGMPMEPAVPGGGPWDKVISEHGDFDADLWSDLIVYRPSTGTWLFLNSGGLPITLQY